MKKGLVLVVISAILAACGGKGQKAVEPAEDLNAKKLLQGIWVDAETGDLSFQAEGDSIFYPDSMNVPAKFMIVGDTLFLQGSNMTKYPIVKQTEHLFQFINQNGDVVKLNKSDGKELEQAFEQEPSVTLNQRKTIKRDTVVFSGADRYHCYVQVNPTKQKVFKSKINDDGVSVDNVYYDNSIRVSIFEGRSRIYQHDFHKEDFARLVPQDFLRQSILSDILVIDNDAESVNYNAHLVLPDSPSSYIINVKISYKGKMSMNVSE